MTLKIISADDTLFEGEVTRVTLPGEMGEFTVLRNHASLVSTLTSGKVTFAGADGAEGAIDVTGGIVDVNDNVISVCVY